MRSIRHPPRTLPYTYRHIVSYLQLHDVIQLHMVYLNCEAFNNYSRSSTKAINYVQSYSATIDNSLLLRLPKDCLSLFEKIDRPAIPLGVRACVLWGANRVWFGLVSISFSVLARTYTFSPAGRRISALQRSIYVLPYECNPDVL